MNFFWSYKMLVDQFEPVNYGYLYNWYAVDTTTTGTDIAASGWHVPTIIEQQTMATYLGGGSIAGGKMKETGFTYWDTPNTGATNEVGFNGRASGGRLSGGAFGQVKLRQAIWSSTFHTSIYAFIGVLDYNDQEFSCFNNNGVINYGYSVRLIKDSTTLSHGETGTYTGNDGKVYPTICIGTQEWLATNLKETLYRDLSPIPEVTDNTAWAALATGARCVYDNNESNA